MAVQVTSYDIPLYAERHIWVDAALGDDNSGAVNRIDAPFQTLTAAWAARYSLNSTCVVIHIANGTYNITDPIDVTASKHTVFLCESTDKCIINYDNTGQTGTSTALFKGDVNNTFRAQIYLIGGTWTRTGVATGNRMFEVTQARASFWLYDANINDLVGVGGVFWQYTLALVKNCRVISVAGNIVGGSVNQFYRSRFEDSYLECNNDVIDGARSGMYFSRCKIVSLTSVFFAQLINNVFTFTDCHVQQFSAVAKNRGGIWSFRGFNKFEATGNRRVFWTDSSTYNGYYRNTGTLVVCPANGSTGNAWDVEGAQARKFLNAGNYVHPENQLFNTGGAYPNGRIGARLVSSTIGETINMDCTSTTSLWDRDRLVYTVTSSNIVDTLDGMRDMIRNRITTEGQGNPWWEFTKGDINRVYHDGVDDIYVEAAPDCALGFQISGTIQYFNGVDTSIDLNTLPNGLPDAIGGKYLSLTNQPVIYGQTERIIDRLEPVATYRDI